MFSSAGEASRLRPVSVDVSEWVSSLVIVVWWRLYVSCLTHLWCPWSACHSSTLVCWRSVSSTACLSRWTPRRPWSTGSRSETESISHSRRLEHPPVRPTHGLQQTDSFSHLTLGHLGSVIRWCWQEHFIHSKNCASSSLPPADRPQGKYRQWNLKPPLLEIRKMAARK